MSRRTEPWVTSDEKGAALRAIFYGVRGSCPCCSSDKARYGGNTACVVLDAEGEPPLVLDLGTGLRELGMGLPHDGSFRGSALLTHLHWDHVQGLPFFVPVDRKGARLDVYGPVQNGCSLEAAVDGLVRPPYFPVRIGELRGEVAFHGVLDEDFSVGGARVKARPVPHVGPTLGYRVEIGGACVSYISDHQAPPGLSTVAKEVLELCDGADLLVHDAQYTLEELGAKPHWGHCTPEYAVLVAKEAGVRRLALFHHDPSHDDQVVDGILEVARRAAAGTGVDEVIGAEEGLAVQLGS